MGPRDGRRFCRRGDERRSGDRRRLRRGRHRRAPVGRHADDRVPRRGGVDLERRQQLDASARRVLVRRRRDDACHRRRRRPLSRSAFTSHGRGVSDRADLELDRWSILDKGFRRWHDGPGLRGGRRCRLGGLTVRRRGFARAWSDRPRVDVPRWTRMDPVRSHPRRSGRRPSRPGHGRADHHPGRVDLDRHRGAGAGDNGVGVHRCGRLAGHPVTAPVRGYQADPCRGQCGWPGDPGCLRCHQRLGAMAWGRVGRERAGAVSIVRRGDDRRRLGRRYGHDLRVSGAHHPRGHALSPAESAVACAP